MERAPTKSPLAVSGKLWDWVKIKLVLSVHFSDICDWGEGTGMKNLRIADRVKSAD